jgi:hypothetical protein
MQNRVARFEVQFHQNYRHRFQSGAIGHSGGVSQEFAQTFHRFLALCD